RRNSGPSRRRGREFRQYATAGRPLEEPGKIRNQESRAGFVGWPLHRYKGSRGSSAAGACYEAGRPHAGHADEQSRSCHAGNARAAAAKELDRWKTAMSGDHAGWAFARPAIAFVKQTLHVLLKLGLLQPDLLFMSACLFAVINILSAPHVYGQDGAG